MGEGVDPTQMCQSLVDKVAQSKQLMAITDPDLLVLFEDWFEELEEEVISLVKRYGPMSARELAEKIGVLPADALRPGAVVVEQLTQSAHATQCACAW